MKIKKLICIAVMAVMLVSLCAVSSSAEAKLSISQDYSENKRCFTEYNSKKKAEELGAVMVHNMLHDGDAVGSGIGYLSGGPLYSWQQLPDETGIRLDQPDTLEGVDLPYIAYEVKAGDGNCIDSLSLGLKYIVAGSNPDAGQFLQIGVYVLDSLGYDKSGSIDFSDKQAAKVLGGGWEYDGNHMTDALDINLSAYAKSFGERQSIYVVIVSYSNSSMMGDDGGRWSKLATQYNRICGVDITATETKATGPIVTSPEAGEDPAPDTEAPKNPDAGTTGAPDNGSETNGDTEGDSKDSKISGTLIGIIAGVVVVAVVVVTVIVSKKKK